MPTDRRINARHKARRVAVQSLYWLESQPWDKLRDVITQVSEEVNLPGGSRGFALNLANGFMKNRGSYERELTLAASNWEPDRIGRLEHLIVGIALAEWDDQDLDSPPKVVLNEAVTLAGEFAGEEAARFVNGVLDKLGRDRGVLTDRAQR
jgi:transcription antitermination protein NusB